MSSVPNQAASPTPVRSAAAQAGSKTEQVKQSLHEHLRKTARFIKLMDATIQVFAWLAAVLVLWLVACVIDHWLVPLPVFVRWIFWAIAVTGTAWWLTRFVLPLLFRRINLTYAAKRIEHLVPEFKNGLISWLQLEGMPANGVPRGVMAALAYRAKRFIGGQDPSATVDTSPLIKLIGVVFLLTTTLVVYTIVSPKSVGATARRILFPWASLAAPTRVKLLSVKPGAAIVTQGKALPVEVEVRGLRTDEPVYVRYTTADGQLVNQQVELDAVTKGFKYAGNVATAGAGVEHEFVYSVEAGDATSGPFRVSLSPLPTVVLESVALEYPAYTRLPPRVISGGKVEAPEGTMATILARANQTMKRGHLEIIPREDNSQTASRVDMQVDDRQLHAPIRLLLNDDRQNPTEVEYRIRGSNARGEMNPRPITHSMSVLADVGPEITLLGPENRLLRVLPQSRVNLEVRASDPDFGLSQIMLEVRNGGVLVAKTALLENPSGVIGRQVKTSRLNLAKLNVKRGDRIEVLAVALDNRHDPRGGRPAPNRAVSEPLSLQIVGPDEPVDIPEEQPPRQQEKPESSDSEEQKNAESGPPSQQNETQESGDTAGGTGSDTGQNAGGDENQSAGGAGGNADQPSDQSKAGGSETEGGAGSGQQQEGAGGSSQGSGSPDGSDGQTGGERQTSSGQSQPEGANTNQARSGSENAGQSGSAQGATGQSQTGPDSPSDRTGSENGNAGSSSRAPNEDDADVFERVRRFMDQQDAAPDEQTSSNQDSTNSAQSSAQSAGSSDEPQASTSDQSSQQPDNSSAAGQSAETADQDSSSSQSAQDNASSGSSEQPAGSEASDANSQTQNSNNQGSQSGDSEQGTNQSSESQGGDSGTQQPQNEIGDQGSQSTNEDQSGGTESGDSESSGQSGDNQSNQSANQGSQGGDSGSQGSESGSQGSESGSQGSESGSQGSESGSQGSESGSQGSESGSQGSESGSEGSQSANQGDQSSSQGDQSGSSDQTGSPGGEGQTGEQEGGSGAEAESGEQQSDSGNQSADSGSQGGESSNAQSQSGSSSAGSPQSSGEPGQGPPSTQNQPGARGGPGESTGGATAGSGSGAAGGAGGDAGTADAVNQEFADRNQQMALDYLNRQREQPDPELLKELDWTDQDLREFVDRWNKARDLAYQGDDQNRIDSQEQLPELGLQSAAQRARTGSDVNDSFQTMQDSGTRSRPPESLRKQWEAFRKAIETR